MVNCTAALSLAPLAVQPMPLRAPIRQPAPKQRIRLEHEQFREFAELCKREAGQVLELSTFEKMGSAWGSAGFMAWETIKDAREKTWAYTPPIARIKLAESVTVAEFRRAGRTRPELDWSVLAENEIYPFLLWHEIGHCRNNFSLLDASIRGDGIPDDVWNMIHPMSEVLADRSAWSMLRPGEPMPLTASGKSISPTIDLALEYVGRFFQRGKYPVRPLELGQYTNVSPTMLESKHLAAFVGPDVHPELLAHYVWKRAGSTAARGEAQ